MLHKPAESSGPDPAAAYKMRVGAWMLVFYFFFYASFVAINLSTPLLMEKTVLLGMNLATVYGFGLIIVALIQALIYDRMCHREEVELSDGSKEAEGK